MMYEIFFGSLSLTFMVQAGLVYNEFPLMGGRIIPQDIISPFLKPEWRNVFENSSLVQFEHRALAMLTWTGCVSYWVFSRRFNKAGLLAPPANTASHLLFGVSSIQVMLGISTLLSLVPLPLAMAHQAGSLTLLTSGIYLLHTLRGPFPKLLIKALSR
jgi:cytochrome c oxidase assembly protein subunit 15